MIEKVCNVLVHLSCVSVAAIAGHSLQAPALKYEYRSRALLYASHALRST